MVQYIIFKKRINKNYETQVGPTDRIVVVIVQEQDFKFKIRLGRRAHVTYLQHTEPLTQTYPNPNQASAFLLLLLLLRLFLLQRSKPTRVEKKIVSIQRLSS